ncbi:MAG: hypothetical protein M0P31_07375 [Solirubrobacteraceae bacterium]|nr:hypothetical protein [Solirubrobacteraceae bacterium]
MPAIRRIAEDRRNPMQTMTDPTELRRRIEATLTQRAGAVHDQLDDPSHAPDHVGDGDLTHCRLGTPAVWHPQDAR